MELIAREQKGIWKVITPRISDEVWKTPSGLYLVTMSLVAIET